MVPLASIHFYANCHLRSATRLLALVWVLALLGLNPLPTRAQSDPESTENQQAVFFETKIRPVLLSRCLECHSKATEASGGLLLDSLQGWRAGGELGPAIVVGDPDASLILQAIRYDNPKLQMPPDGKLPSDVIDDFRRWIQAGAFDPRTVKESEAGETQSMALSVQQAQQHWAYRPIAKLSSDKLSKLSNQTDDLKGRHIAAAGDRISVGTGDQVIDFLIDSQLASACLPASSTAETQALVRRLYFDLTGLPPTPEQLQQYMTDDSADRYQQLVDRLLASAHYGERMARNWMDVVRYADSITLRGFVLPEAWRYRDYLVQSFNQDRSFQTMIHEQIAGDLMTADSPAQRAMQLTATGFLALGNTNLEKQDKHQLEMDYLDEQLDVIGSAFLGQTIGCARCHDHKFDPIPTSDYYALAGILRSSSGMKHANVSEWVERPLPVDPQFDQKMDELSEQQVNLSQQIKQIKQTSTTKKEQESRFFALESLSGVVVDSSQATLVGNWRPSVAKGKIIGDSYIHDENSGKGEKSATFEPQHLPPGEYEVLLAYQSGENRASQLSVKVFSAEGETELQIDQRKPAPERDLWIRLGKFRFEKDGQAFVLISNDGTDGHVVLDAVRFLPSSLLADRSLSDLLASEENDGQVKDKNKVDKPDNSQLQLIEEQLANVQKALSARPKYLTVVENREPADLPVHIRGSVHSLGQVVPRGFLSAVKIDSSVSGDQPPTRLELARWIADDENMLTSRVYANRIWLWLMGRGLVSTPNNFGTTGAQPSHPELLDWMAGQLVDSNWSTKHLVRAIVMSRAYQRARTDCDECRSIDPENRLYGQGHLRRLPVEALRDTMLSVSGELDLALGGSTIAGGTKNDYNYSHQSTRRSIYQPIFRNSLPDLLDEFDFADPSASIGSRSRSTVAQQGLVLVNSKWVNQRAEKAGHRYQLISEQVGQLLAIQHLYLACFSRLPTEAELTHSQNWLDGMQATADELSELQRWQLLVQALFASLDFRFLD